MSALKSRSASPSACSGDMYATVPSMIPAWLLPLSRLTPNYWGLDALTDLQLGATLTDILPALFWSTITFSGRIKSAVRRQRRKESKVAHVMAENLSAMKVIHGVEKEGGKVVSFRSYCGGLPAPEANTNPIGYKFSWAPRGVLTAATNPARYRQDVAAVECLANPPALAELPAPAVLTCLFNGGLTGKLAHGRKFLRRRSKGELAAYFVLVQR